MSKVAEVSSIFKTLSDITRLQIIDMLSCKEMCACDLLEGLTVNQSTLSHHMKILTESGLVVGRKEATWMYYSINHKTIENLHVLIDKLTSGKDKCNGFIMNNNCENIN